MSRACTPTGCGRRCRRTPDLIGARIKRDRKGEYRIRLPESERELLRLLPGQLRELLTEGAPSDAALQRLYPAAYPDDPDRSLEYDAMVRDDLTERRLDALDTLERTLDAGALTEDELLAWLGALNDLRLVLGTRMDVTEQTKNEDFEGDPEAAQAWAVYSYLSVLVEQIVSALPA